MRTTDVAVRYLREYSDALRTVRSKSDLYGSVLAWQSRNMSVGCEAQSIINDEFLGRDEVLVADHPPTTAVGAFKGLVVLSANPGYEPKRNAAEKHFRESQNREFCESFFSAARGLSQDIGWWRSVVRFSYRAMTGDTDGATPMDDLWDWAGSSEAVGAIDLVPW
jgi:hypothetical protein